MNDSNSSHSSECADGDAPVLSGRNLRPRSTLHPQPRYTTISRPRPAKRNTKVKSKTKKTDEQRLREQFDKMGDIPFYKGVIPSMAFIFYFLLTPISQSDGAGRCTQRPG
jgi:RNA recognition motif-containing protein